MDIDSVVEEIRQREEKWMEEAENLREELKEGEADTGPFIREIEEAGIEDIDVAAVDGGLARKEFHGADIYLRRAVAAVFGYTGGALDSSEYLPGKNPSPETEYVTGNMDRKEADRLASLLRLEAEISVAEEAAGSADLLLLDGSLVPQPGDRPAVDSDLFERYEELVARYRELYSGAEERGVELAGVVEDARSSRMCEALEDRGYESERLENGRDSALLQHLLDPGQRTASVPYTESSTPVLDDLGVDQSLHVFYLRTVEKDRPVRVEFLSQEEPEKEADRIAGKILALCGSGSSYGIPPVLIEADQRASLSTEEVELLTKRVEAKLAHLTGGEGLRRDRRPF
ncbi:MAG: DNA double-strand break repair nuclease NurA [Candidatus Nanohaloarchaea archaeon]|nr:DNA double-strand break repair nuclease NurA [Candidatus Nanohaloarchaea archaeon]